MIFSYHRSTILFRFFAVSIFIFLGIVFESCNSGQSKDRSGNNTLLSDQKLIKLGIIPLTDCAPLVIAFEKGIFKKYGLNVEISKEASWANVRDKLLTGELQGAHCLFGMPFSV